MCVRYVANGQILVYFGITSCYCIYLRFVILIVYFCMYFLVLHDVVCISGETSVFWSSSYTLRLRLFTVVLMVFLACSSRCLVPARVPHYPLSLGCYTFQIYYINFKSGGG